jgi:hypothetical protein
MQASPETPSAAAARARLEHTRRALLRHMAQDLDGPHGPDDSSESAAASMAREAHKPGRFAHEAFAQDEGLGVTWQHLRHGVSAWWQSHPAHLVLEVAEPIFDKYARAHPARVLTVSAAAGAALVLLRPWRLISVTGLLVAAVKSTQMSALADHLLRPRPTEPLRRGEAAPDRAQHHPR